jgi:transposase InsO family protein
MWDACKLLWPLFLGLFRPRASLEAENLALRQQICHGHPRSPHIPRSPWQNGYAERLIGSIRRECIDHVIVFGECHLRHLLRSYLNYYNETRTHLSLDKDAPVSRAIQTAGRVFARPVLGGLHHQYVRI